MTAPENDDWCIGGSCAGLSMFDDRLDRFRAWQDEPWGRLRYEQVHANLLRHLPARPLRVVDAGGGNGLDALRLAEAGHRVTIVDTSATALEAAQAQANRLGIGDRVDCRKADLRDIANLVGDQDIDLVLCHNVIQYVADRRSALTSLVATLRPGGLLSVLSVNPHSDPLAAAVKRTDPVEALRLLHSNVRTSVTYGGAAVDSCSAEELSGELVAAGTTEPSRYGVRAVCDLIADDERKHDPDFFATLVRLENDLADRRPYLEIARFYHLIATKPTTVTERAEPGVVGRRVPIDLEAYETLVRTGDCFICGYLDGKPGYEHETVYDDGEHVAFMNNYPTLPGHLLVVPRRHVENVVTDLTAEEYVRLQAAVHTVATAAHTAMRPERTYIMSLGSNQGNAHVHWHIAPLPPNVPYRQQQLYTLDAAHGVLDLGDTELAALADRIRSALPTKSPQPGGAAR